MTANFGPKRTSSVLDEHEAILKRVRKRAERLVFENEFFYRWPNLLTT